MRRQSHRDVRTLLGLRGRRNRSETVATSGWKPLEASICDGGPGGRRDGRRVDRAAASPRPRPRAAVQLPAERAATLESLAAVEQVLEHSTRSGDWRGLRRGRDRNRARRRATRVPRTLDNDHRRCAPSGRSSWRISSATSAAGRVDDFETRARGAVDSAARRGRP
mmetsp:Transcript_3438/g.10911  ORF Transcript_3438/g.10911 Transcript_3438/m.10911 type:complete len:166 (-) Transcript_3438:89-586(-)